MIWNEGESEDVGGNKKFCKELGMVNSGKFESFSKIMKMRLAVGEDEV